MNELWDKNTFHIVITDLFLERLAINLDCRLNFRHYMCYTKTGKYEHKSVDVNLYIGVSKLFKNITTIK